MEKKNLTVLLAKIDSKLNLLQAMMAQYETQIPTVAARVRQAKLHLQQTDALFIDLSWITRTILSKKILKKLFEHQALDLHILKEQLAQYVASEASGKLNEAIIHWRKKILKVLESVEHDLLIIEEQTGKLAADIGKSFTNFLSAEKKMKDVLLVPSARSENDLISALAIMTQDVSTIGSILLSPGKIDPIPAAQVQALRKVMLRDWNILLQGMVNLFLDAFKETKPIREVRIIVGRTGVPELSIQA